MKIQNIQYTQVKTEDYEILLPKKMSHIEIEEWNSEDSNLEQFAFICKGILERNLLDEKPCFEEVNLAMIIYFLRGKMYINQRYQMFETKQDERKFVECLIHREDVLKASKGYEVLYERLKEKPRVDGFIGHKYIKDEPHDGYVNPAKMYDEEQEGMKKIGAFIKYEEGDLK
ncbi:TPA: hypothetical protein ACIQMB_005453 [Bacillus pacificus]